MKMPDSPTALLEAEMQKLGVSREGAIYLVLRSFEATLRAEDGSNEGIEREIFKLLLKDTKDRHPHAVELAEASLRKDLPEWTRIHDEAVARDQDPVTSLAIKTKCTTERAKSRLRRVQEAKAGKSISESTEISLSEDDGKTFSELWAEHEENQKA
jgi:hypothetical protein